MFGREQRTCRDIHHEQSETTTRARRLGQHLILCGIGTEITYEHEAHECVEEAADVVLKE